MASSRRTARVSSTTLRLGSIFVTVSLLAGAALFQKQHILTIFRPGTTISVDFAAAHRLREFVSEAKIAGVRIGVVKSVRRTANGGTEVQLKVDRSSLDAMGTAPSAAIRPTTMLGGNYYVEIIPGGRRGTFSGTIPVSRTRLPVELDQVAAALPFDARTGIRSSISDLDATLGTNGSRALRNLVTTAPQTLTPAAGAFKALQGTRPESDLRRLVGGLETTSAALSDKQGQLDAVVTDLAKTTSVLAARSNEMATATAQMPSTLDDADAMLTRLGVTLDLLRDTAGRARPTAKNLNAMLKDLGPVVAEARPVVSDLRTTLNDARPSVRDLVPTTVNLTGSLTNIHGPVLDRINGPLTTTVLSPWHGTGHYAGGGADRPFYKELAYMVSNLAQANMEDRNGAMVSFLPGVGAGSVGGLPISLEQLFAQLASPKGARR